MKKNNFLGLAIGILSILLGVLPELASFVLQFKEYPLGFAILFLFPFAYASIFIMFRHKLAYYILTGLYFIQSVYVVYGIDEFVRVRIYMLLVNFFWEFRLKFIFDGKLTIGIEFLPLIIFMILAFRRKSILASNQEDSIREQG